MKVFSPNYFTYVSPLAGMLGILAFFPAFLYVTIKYNSYLFTIITFLVLILGYFFINYILISVKKIILSGSKMDLLTSIGGAKIKSYVFDEIKHLELTKIYMNIVFFELRRTPLAELKSSWLTQVPRPSRYSGGEIKYYLTIKKADSELDEYLLTGYTDSTMEKFISEIKPKLGNKFTYDNYLTKQGYGRS